MTKQSVNLNGKTILVTKSPGFIRANLVLRPPQEMKSRHIVSFNNMNDRDDIRLKERRLPDYKIAKNGYSGLLSSGSRSGKGLA